VAPKINARLKHIEFVNLGPGRALVILVGEDGSVENRVIEVPRGLPPSTFAQASNYLSTRFQGKTIDEVQRFVRDFAPTRGRKIAERSQALVTEAIAEGARKSEGPEQVAARVRAILEGQMAAGRARTIARTETVAAQNAALLALADEDGREVRKEWVAVEDARTRATHAKADGQVVEPGGRFTVGTAKLLHPGDPSGPPGEIINCRCAMLLTTVRRRNPRPPLTVTR
jgi:transcriptional regulator of heat shock response